MAEVPILMQIHDKFDRYERYPYTDHSEISGIELTSDQKGYKITTYPGGIGSIYDGLVLNVTAEGGIFSQIGPARIETARTLGSLISFSVDSESVDKESGLVDIRGKVDPPAKLEALVLPGYDGFELFEKLHQEIQGIKPIVEDLATVVNPSLRPVTLSYKSLGGSDSMDPTNRQITTYGRDVYILGDKFGDITNFALECSSVQPIDPQNMWNYSHRFRGYNSGIATNQMWKTRQEIQLNPLTLHTLSWLHASMEGLYRSR